MTTSRFMAISGLSLGASRPPDTGALVQFLGRMAEHRSGESAWKHCTGAIRNLISLLNTRAARCLQGGSRTRQNARTDARICPAAQPRGAARRRALRQQYAEECWPDQTRPFSNCPQIALSADGSALTAPDAWARRDRCKEEIWT